jgi:hypothetical protein
MGTGAALKAEPRLETDPVFEGCLILASSTSSRL